MIKVKTRAFNLGIQDISSIKNKRGYWVKIFFFVIAAFATSPAFAQILIEGTIKDKETKEGLPFAHVHVEGTPTVTVADIDGIFVISVPSKDAEKKLIISNIGYNNFEQTPAEIQANQTKEFLLESAVFDLELTVVKSPEKILKDAMSKIDENYWTEPFMVEGFYRKGALENDKFTYLTEAIIEYYNRGYHKTEKTSLDINIVQLRNSEDFRQVKMIQHHNPIYNTLYNFDKIKTRYILKQLNATKMGTAKMEVSVYDGESIYIINLAGLKIYVGFDNDKIYRIDTKGKRDIGSSFQYRAYKGKLYPFYFRIKHFIKDGQKIVPHMITDYKGQDIRGLADSLAEATVHGEALGNRMKVVDQQSKAIMVKMSKEILKKSDLDLIGWIQEFVATDVVLKSEKKYKRRNIFGYIYINMLLLSRGEQCAECTPGRGCALESGVHKRAVTSLPQYKRRDCKNKYKFFLQTNIKQKRLRSTLAYSTSSSTRRDNGIYCGNRSRVGAREGG